MTEKNRINREPLKNRLMEYADGGLDKIKDILSRCDCFSMLHNNEQDCRIIKDTVEEVRTELK